VLLIGAAICLFAFAWWTNTFPPDSHAWHSFLWVLGEISMGASLLCLIAALLTTNKESRPRDTQSVTAKLTPVRLTRTPQEDEILDLADSILVFGRSLSEGDEERLIAALSIVMCECRRAHRQGAL
jgi:hypothetical protein